MAWLCFLPWLSETLLSVRSLIQAHVAVGRTQFPVVVRLMFPQPYLLTARDHAKIPEDCTFFYLVCLSQPKELLT